MNIPLSSFSGVRVDPNPALLPPGQVFSIEARRVQKYKRTLRPTRRAVAEFIYHYQGELNHQGLGNAFVFLDTTAFEYLDQMATSTKPFS